MLSFLSSEASLKPKVVLVLSMGLVPVLVLNVLVLPLLVLALPGLMENGLMALKAKPATPPTRPRERGKLGMCSPSPH